MLRPETIITFKKDGQLPVELRNFWPMEEGFVWSSGKWCEVPFDFAVEPQRRSDQAELVLDLDVYKSPPGLESQNVFIYLNGLRIGSRKVTKRVTAFFEFDPAILKPTNLLVLDTPDATSPATFSGTDKRVLGVQLFSFQIRYFTPVAAAVA